MTIINFYENTINYCFVKFKFDLTARNLHETTINREN